MVAKIISGKSIIGALNYNENKVAQGKAELIFQNGYAKDIHLLKFHDKLFRLKELSSRNERVKTNTVHISLNFAIGENHPKELLNEIAADYMDRIGFGNQPYLVYQHTDAGHPHIHIVSTNIKSTGERISLHNLGRTKSEEARKAIEQNFNLIPATQKEKSQSLNSFQLAKVEYGKIDTKRALTNVVNGVVRSYRFTSLPELNAVLQQYNVVADRGSKESRMYTKNGLVYWVLDSKRNKIGVPIKASGINGKPTLKNLEEKFQNNEELRKPYKEKIKNTIDTILQTKASIAGFKQALQSKGIEVVFRQNEQGFLYGVTYVDNQSKVVFNGSDLGKSYSAAALNDWFSTERQNNRQFPSPQSSSLVDPFKMYKPSPQATYRDNEISGKTILDDLLKADNQNGVSMPGMAKNKRRKKRKRLSQ